jgi:sugar phosphate permease
MEKHLQSHRWAVFGVFAAIYFLVYFHRVSTSVIVSDLISSFQASAAALGFMSSMYFYCYALEQPLVGRLSDRLGPRRVVGIWTLVAALGCLLFGLAPSIAWASAGRALIGLGVGGVYVPAMKAFSQWFHRREFSTMTGLLLACGNLGAIFATTPLAWLSANWGWRAAFFTIGALTLLFGLLCLIALQDYREKGDTENIQAQTSNSGTYRVVASWRFWILGALFFGVFGGAITFQGLWATPFLMAVLKVERLEASGLNMLIPTGFMLGAPVSGWLADRLFGNKANLLVVHASILVALWTSLALFPERLGYTGMVAILPILGATVGGMGTTLWGTVQESTPSRSLGTTTGLLNIFPLLGMAVMQGVTGAVVDRAGRIHGLGSSATFRGAFLICLAATAACLVLCLWIRRNTAIRPGIHAKVSRDED